MTKRPIDSDNDSLTKKIKLTSTQEEDREKFRQWKEENAKWWEEHNKWRKEFNKGEKERAERDRRWREREEKLRQPQNRKMALAVLFDKNCFSLDDAVEWLLSHRMKSIHDGENDQTYYFKLQDYREGEETETRQICNGLKIIMLTGIGL